MRRSYALTLDFARFLVQKAWLMPKRNRTIDRGNTRDTVSQPSFEFVQIIITFPTTASVLAEDGIDTQAERPIAQQKWILCRSFGQ